MIVVVLKELCVTVDYVSAVKIIRISPRSSGFDESGEFGAPPGSWSVGMLACAMWERALELAGARCYQADVKKKRARGDSVRNPRRKWDQVLLLLLTAGVVVAISLGVRLRLKEPAAADRYLPRPRGTLTFNKDVAPIVFERCARCHRPGQAAPFSLLSYSDVKKRAKQIVEVTARRYM